ncbi:MAG TPA: Uma2 family endonuclease [Frankiaceae bacterium]|nr:Uma2 family endonuclease [Frankiaceae bacterium]
MVLPRATDAGFTWEDLQALPDDGNRYELMEGVLSVVPPPDGRHQLCAYQLTRLLFDARPPELVVRIAPFDYTPEPGTSLEPDVLVARREDMQNDRLRATPQLVVEVASPRTRRHDRGDKLLAYQEFGVPYYWLVDPAVPSLTALHLVDGQYVEVATATGETPYTTDKPFPVTVIPARLLDE